MATDLRPAAQPRAILRGHKAQVHAAAFCRANARLVTGDADGFVVVWDLAILRPRAVWQAHGNAILGIAGWGDDRIITHGRDHKLIAWKLGADDEEALSIALPLESTPEPRPLPWMLHMLEVNTMNFCAFASCPASAERGAETSEVLLAVPNTLASEAIDIFQLPTQERLHTVKLGDKNGMVMALALFHGDAHLTLVAGYENGVTMVAQDGRAGWTMTYRAQPHTQPILSIDVAPSSDYFLTSSADANIAKHPLPTLYSPDQQPNSATLASHGAKKPGLSALSAALAGTQGQSTPTTSSASIQTDPLKIVNTKHAGQQSICIRSDAKVFATAGWDAKIRVYSCKTMKELAVLKWHQVGCYAVALAQVSPPSRAEAVSESHETSTDTSASQAVAAIPRPGALTLKEKRVLEAQSSHWLAAGSKDGKVSLWNVF